MRGFRPTGNAKQRQKDGEGGPHHQQGEEVHAAVLGRGVEGGRSVREVAPVRAVPLSQLRGRRRGAEECLCQHACRHITHAATTTDWLGAVRFVVARTSRSTSARVALSFTACRIA